MFVPKSSSSLRFISSSYRPLFTCIYWVSAMLPFYWTELNIWRWSKRSRTPDTEPSTIQIQSLTSVAAAKLIIPESVQSPAWILQSSRQLLHSWVSWMIVAQVQLSQMGGVGVQSWDQRSTAFLCDQTAWQPVDTQNITDQLRVLMIQCTSVFKGLMFIVFIKLFFTN